MLGPGNASLEAPDAQAEIEKTMRAIVFFLDLLQDAYWVVSW